MASESEVRLVMIGKTGSGKSATGNKILGETIFKSSASGKSITKMCSYHKGFNAGREICIVDTPGLFDTDMSNEETQGEVKRCVALSAPGPHAIIFVTKIGRFTAEEENTIKFFVKNFGEEMYRYLIVLFTGGDDLEEEEKSFDDFIADSPSELRKILHLAGNRKVVFNNRSKNVDVLNGQVENLFNMVDLMVECNGGVCYTNQMYEEVEANLRAVEEEKRREAEAKKENEIERIRSECKEDMEEQIKKLNEKHEAVMKKIRDEHRKEIKQGNGFFVKIGKVLDKIIKF